MLIYQMENNDFYYFVSIKENIEWIRSNFKFVRKQQNQPLFGYLQLDRQKPTLDIIYQYIMARINQMLVSSYVSITEFVDIFTCFIRNFEDNIEIIALLRKVQNEKIFVDDFIEVYKRYERYMLCPDRITIRDELHCMYFEDVYCSEYLHDIVNHGFITKEELFDFLPKARACFDNFESNQKT